MAVFCFFIFYFGFNSRAINYFVFSLVGGGIAHFWPVFFGEGWFNVVGNLSFDKPMFFVLGFLSTLLMSYVVFSKR